MTEAELDELMARMRERLASTVDPDLAELLAEMHVLRQRVQSLQAKLRQKGARKWRGACGCIVRSATPPPNPCVRCGGDFYGKAGEHGTSSCLPKGSEK